jgi:hypothetical protein
MPVLKQTEDVVSSLSNSVFNVNDLSGASIQQSFEKQQENLEWRANLWDNDPLELVGQKIKGMGYSFRKNNLLLSLTDYMENFSGIGYDIDDKFKEEYTQDRIAQIGELMGLSTEQTLRLAEAKNKNHFQQMINRYEEMKSEDKFVDKVNTTAETVGSSLLGSVVDANVPIAGWAYKASKTLGVGKTVALTTATDITLDTAFATVRDDYTMEDVAINSFISLGMNRVFAKAGRREIDELAEARASKQREADIKVQKEKEAIQKFSEEISEHHKELRLTEQAKKRKRKEVENIQRSNKLTQEEKQLEIKKIEDAEIERLKEEELLTAQAKELKEKERLAIEKARNIVEQERLSKEAETEAKESKLIAEARRRKQKEIDSINNSNKLTEKEKQNKIDIANNAEQKLISEAKRLKQKELDNINKSRKLTEEERIAKIAKEDMLTQQAKELKRKEVEKLNNAKKLIEKEKKQKIISKRLKFFKKQDEIINKAKKEKDIAFKKEQDEWFAKQRKDQEEMYNIISSNIDEAFKATMEDIKKAYKSMDEADGYQIQQMKKDIDNMVEAIFNIDNTRGQKLRAEIRKQTGANKKEPLIKGRISKDGKVNLVDKNGRSIGKLPLAILGTTGIATIASADDGSDVGVYDAVTALTILAVAGFGGRQLFNRFGNNGNIIKSNANKIKEKLKDGYTQVKNKGFTAEIDSGLNKAKADFFTATGKLINNDTPEKFTNLIYNWRDGVKHSAEDIARSFKEKVVGVYSRAEYENFKGWLRATNQDTINPFKKGVLLKEFRYRVADIVEGKAKASNEFEEAMAKESSSIFSHSLDLALEAGVESFGKVRKIDNYLPRMWRNGKIKEILSSTDEDGRLKIITALSDAVYAKQSKKNRQLANDVAEFKIFNIENQGYSKGDAGDMEYDNLITYLKDKYDDVNEQDIAQIFTKKDDIIGRFKERIDMDMSFLEGVEVKQNGLDTKLNLSDFVERDMQVIIDNYAREMGGHIALAKHGFKTEAQFTREVFNEAPLAVREDLIKVKDLILGRPIGDTSDSFPNTLVNTSRNLAIMMSMPLMALSTTPEILMVTAKTLARSGGYKRVSDEIKTFMNSYRKGDYMTQQLSEMTGLGSNYVNHNLTIRDANEVSNLMDSKGLIEGSTARGRDVFIKYFGMGKIQDFNERLMIINNTEDLAGIINGTKTISDKRMLQYGITDKTKELLSEHLKISDSGKLLNFNKADLSKDAIDELDKVIRNMTIRNINRSTIGGIPLMFVESPVGRMMGTLGGFAITSYSNMGLRGVYNRDPETAISGALWFAGAYLGVYAREVVTERENTEEERIWKSMLNMPLSGISVFGTMTNSPSFQLLEQASFLSDMYNADIGEE